MNTTPQATYADLYERQRAFFEAGHTLKQSVRESWLRALMDGIRKRENDINAALYEDLRKSPVESMGSEWGFVNNEIRHTLKHLGAWMKPQRKLAPVAAQPGMSVVYPQPLGATLILGAWNYPFQLVVAPLIPALAAGNTAVLKPSELSPATSSVVADLIGSVFSPEHVACVEGGVEASTALLEQPWEHLFFTGGTRVGRIIARAGAETLARVTLELGGKSPAIVSHTANLEVAARRIMFGKVVNAGQTCIAPDYVLVHEAVHDELVHHMSAHLTRMLGDDPQQSQDLGRIVNDRHFQRLRGLMDSGTVAHGGRHDADDRYIEPTLLTGVSWDDAVMQEEIFGPILPILKVRSVEDAIREVRRHRDPLALYLFTEDKAEKDAVLARISFGGGCVNNTLVHLTDPDLPFGGIRTSGIGAYHGRSGFDRFTHYKSVLESSSARLLDPDLKYPPYAGRYELMKKLLG